LEVFLNGKGGEGVPLVKVSRQGFSGACPIFFDAQFRVKLDGRLLGAFFFARISGNQPFCRPGGVLEGSSKWLVLIKMEGSPVTF